MNQRTIELYRKISDHFIRTTMIFASFLFLLFAFEYYKRPELIIIELMFVIALIVKGITFGLKAVRE